MTATGNSRTITLNQTRTIALRSEGLYSDSESNGTTTAGTLRLRGGSANEDRKVQWDDGVVDNEGLGRKKSKICCIYHKPRAFDEPSSESSSSSDDSASENDDSSSIPSGCNDHHHHHKKRKSKKQRSPSPNAYERQPQYKSRPRSKD